MTNYIDIFLDGYKSYASYLWTEITNPSWHSYFYWLIGVSLFFFALEIIIPWRKSQATFRKDFWLDVFYMFFNFFLFSLIIYNAASEVVVNVFNDGILQLTGINLKSTNPMYSWPLWAVLLVGFVVRDFVQWWVHRLLHRSDTLWKFHKVHHSVEEMGFAAHLRYHWMENIVYRTIEYIPLALLGIGLYDFFIIHIFTLAWGHYNHSNISINDKITGGILGAIIGIIISQELLDVSLISDVSTLMQVAIIIGCILVGSLLLGPWMRKLFNSPDMHIWHHAYDLPNDHRYGVNFGLTLAIWDYLFGTAYVPHTGRDIRLGFDGVEQFPQTFSEQLTYGIVKDSQSSK